MWGTTVDLYKTINVHISIGSWDEGNLITIDYNYSAIVKRLMLEKINNGSGLTLMFPILSQNMNPMNLVENKKSPTIAYKL